MDPLEYVPIQASVLSETAPRIPLWSTMHVCAPFRHHGNVCGASNDIIVQLTLAFLTRSNVNLHELHSHRQGEVYRIISLPPLWLRPLTGNIPMAELGSIRHLFHLGNNIKNSSVSFLNKSGPLGPQLYRHPSLSPNTLPLTSLSFSLKPPPKHNQLVLIVSIRSHLHTAFRSHVDK